MAITRSDVRYYLDPLVGGYEPMIGGPVTFSRDDQNKFYLNRNRRIARSGAGKLNPAWAPQSAPFRRRPLLDLERSVFPLLPDSVDILGSGSAWAASVGVDVKESRPSAFDDFPDSAWYVKNNDGSGSNNVQQVQTTFSGTVEVMHVIVEGVPGALTSNCQLMMFDDTASTTIARVGVDFAAGSVSWINAADRFGFDVLSDSGPNGGPLYHVWFTYGTTSGNTRRPILRADEFSGTNPAIFHFASSVNLDWPPAPLAYTGSAVSHASEVMTVDAVPPPDDLAGYMAFIATGRDNNERIWEVGDGTNPRIEIRQDGNDPAGSYEIVFRDAQNDLSAPTADLSPVGWEVGALVELVWAINVSDGSSRIMGRVNGGDARQGSQTGGVAGWDVPADWSTRTLTYNQAAGGGGTGRTRLLREYWCNRGALDEPPLTGSDDAILDEMADFHLPPAA